MKDRCHGRFKMFYKTGNMGFKINSLEPPQKSAVVVWNNEFMKYTAVLLFSLFAIAGISQSSAPATAERVTNEIITAAEAV